MKFKQYLLKIKILFALFANAAVAFAHPGSEHNHFFSADATPSLFIPLFIVAAVVASVMYKRRYQ